MTEKRFKYSEFCDIVVDILENERNGITTRHLEYLFSVRTGKHYWNGMRQKLHRMRKDDLIKATYSTKGYRWWNKKDKITLNINETVIE